MMREGTSFALQYRMKIPLFILLLLTACSQYQIKMRPETQCALDGLTPLKDQNDITIVHEGEEIGIGSRIKTIKEIKCIRPTSRYEKCIAEHSQHIAVTVEDLNQGILNMHSLGYNRNPAHNYMAFLENAIHATYKVPIYFIGVTRVKNEESTVVDHCKKEN